MQKCEMRIPGNYTSAACSRNAVDRVAVVQYGDTVRHMHLCRQHIKMYGLDGTLANGD